jgi:SagB-type dehydrogenase family enzyme
MAGARTVAEEYHRLTRYTAENLRSHPALDWSLQPKPWKEIVSDRRISLRPWLPFQNDPFTGRPLPPAPASLGTGLGMGEISRLLFFANGVTGVVRFEGGGTQTLRAAPSAGALYPNEVYLIVRGLPDLEAGIYNYQVHEHELVPLWEGDFFGEIRAASGGSPAMKEARAVVLLTGVFWRSAWRYQERGYRRVLLDSGHVLANLVASAPRERCAAVPAMGFCDAAVNGLFFLDDTEEAAVALLPIVEETVPADPEPLLSSGPSRATKLPAANFTSPADVARSATLELHRRSSCEPGAAAPPLPPADRRISADALPLPPSGDIESQVPQALLRRRSARRYSGGSIPLPALAAILGYAFGRGDGRGEGRPVRFATREAGWLRAHLLSFEVEGLDPGLYEIERDGEALLPIESTAPKDELFRIALGQEIARLSAATVALSAPLRSASAALGDRAYRYLHLEAGHLGQRLQIAASALGLSACGIGGFLDDEAGELLRLERGGITLYFVTLGREP